MEEQTATTNEMGRNVTDAASGAGIIATGIGSIAQGAKGSKSALEEMSSSFTDLRELSDELNRRVSTFRV
ncbi:hypothetical protein GCM10025883_32210 [Mobilicoccus caccae]|uniref:Methyl-accepting chemotaxis protein n=1 Tax=Mobilicoccus caccae TaxID=1859295 RepID=A0ABQ6IVT9_9MICO|nr:hypothetical protein GCM10025883_32210 [Mobilicoccus caccae]